MQSELSFFFHTFQQELGSGQWNVNIPYKKTVLQVIKTNNFSNIFQWDYIRCNMWNRIEENNVCIEIHWLARDLPELENLLPSMILNSTCATGENGQSIPSLKMQKRAQLKNFIWKITNNSYQKLTECYRLRY